MPSWFNKDTLCRVKSISAMVWVDEQRKCLPFFSPTGNDWKDVTLFDENLCANNIQDQGEEGIDCGGPCPARCRNCFADAEPGHGEVAKYFKLNSELVHGIAQGALEEYLNCLKDPNCRNTLPSIDPLMDFSTITVEDLARNSDYIMEAVAYFVDKNGQWMSDGDWPYYDDCQAGAHGGICDNFGVINAEDMIIWSQFREGCTKHFCGDCEDLAVLREALMRALGISWRCAFLADHYDGFWGRSGHTFNLVYYRNKWRIMDYHPLGYYFESYWNEHKPHSLWNDHIGEYWCPDWRDNINCDKINPYDYTQNYNQDGVCALDFESRDYTYYLGCAP
jgi:hypothetical protein